MKKLLLLFFIFLLPITVLVCIDNYFSEKSELFIEKEVTTIHQIQPVPKTKSTESNPSHRHQQATLHISHT